MFLPKETYCRKDSIKAYVVFSGLTNLVRWSLSITWWKKPLSNADNLDGSTHTFWDSTQQTLPRSSLGKVHCLGRERGLLHITAKMHFNISTILTKRGKVGKSLFTLKAVPHYTRFPPFSNGQVIYMASPVPHCFKTLLYALHAKHYAVVSLHNSWDEQFVKRFLNVQQERSNQKVGMVASLPVL